MTGAHTVTVVPEGSGYACAAERSVLHGMEHAGAQGIPVGCRNGGCGVCRVRVLAGTYTTRKMSKAFVTEADLAEGIVLACRTTPTGDLTVQCCPKPPAVATPAGPQTRPAITTSTVTNKEKPWE